MFTLMLSSHFKHYFVHYATTTLCYRYLVWFKLTLKYYSQLFFAYVVYVCDINIIEKLFNDKKIKAN